MRAFIERELDFDRPAAQHVHIRATELIVRSADGVLRKCRQPLPGVDARKQSEPKRWNHNDIDLVNRCVTFNRTWQNGSST